MFDNSALWAGGPGPTVRGSLEGSWGGAAEAAGAGRAGAVGRRGDPGLVPSSPRPALRVRLLVLCSPGGRPGAGGEDITLRIWQA